MKKMIVAVAAASLLASASPASARGHFSGSIWIDPGWYPWWQPYYVLPPVVVEPRQPPPEVYLEPEPQPFPDYWYYCREPKGYYPYVQRCPNGWKRIAPAPRSQEKEE